jgi:hypothetical protein
MPKLADELAQRIRVEVLIPFTAKRREATDAVVPALLQIAALHAMAGFEMGPDDFAAFAHRVAEHYQPFAREIREKGEAIARGDAPMPAPPPLRQESLVEKQVRLVLEQQCRAIADKLKDMCPAGVGFALFLADYGEKGNTAYVSSVDREDMIRLVEEWLERQKAERR